MNTLTEVRAVLDAHAKLRVDAVTLAAETNLYSAGMTSHASINVMLALEDNFEIEFPDELLTKSTFTTIASISGAIDRLRTEAE